MYVYASIKTTEEGFSIEVIVHYPKSKEMLDELAKRMATIHAQAILNTVSRLDCPTSQKIELISAVQELILRDMELEAKA